MGKSLVIVESPAKAKTINKYLGPNYIVKSSIGHIRDLPTSGSAARRKIAEAEAALKAKATAKKKTSKKKKVKKVALTEAQKKKKLLSYNELDHRLKLRANATQ